MKFRKLSVAGYAWLHDFDLQEEAAKLEDAHDAAAQSRRKKKGKGIVKRIAKITVPARQASHWRMSSLSTSTVSPSASIRRSGSVNLWKSTARPSKAQPEMRTEDLLKFMQNKPHSIFTRKAKLLLLSLALCHTCLPEVKENGDIEFQAASPDELALVKAAQELGYLVLDRSSRSITLTHPGGPDSSEQVTETYEILDVIEFSSKRKRMSIIVRFPDGRICIFCKGADSAIMPRLKLAPTAMQKKAEVSRRSSVRKSLEAEEALRRKSMGESSPRASFNRNSMGLSRGPSMSANRKSTGYGRNSMAIAKLEPTTTSASALTGRLDEMIDEGLVLDEAMVFERCFQHIDDFASEGLRTLLFGYRLLDEEEYESKQQHHLLAPRTRSIHTNRLQVGGKSTWTPRPASSIAST